jgi:hypothetical protein
MAAALRIFENFMSVEVDGREVATAEWSKDNTADCTGVWTVSWCTNRLLNRNQAITALTVAELRAKGHTDDDPLVAALLEELHP